MRELSHFLVVAWAALSSCLISTESHGVADNTIRAITAEATRSNADAIGYPLPLAATWGAGEIREMSGKAHNIVDDQRWASLPLQQIQLIEQGHYILPTLTFNPELDIGDIWPSFPSNEINKFYETNRSYYRDAFRMLSRYHLPFTLKSTEYEFVFCTFAEPRAEDGSYWCWFKDSQRLNPRFRRQLSSFSPPQPYKPSYPQVLPSGEPSVWGELGSLWTKGNFLKELQTIYPDPPLVQFLSNNEYPRLDWRFFPEQANHTGNEALKAWVDAHHLSLNPNESPVSDNSNWIRRVFFEGWRPLYGALFQGAKAELPPAWAHSTRFAGYDSFFPWNYGLRGVCFDDAGGNQGRNLLYPGNLVPWSQIWDGNSIHLYRTLQGAMTLAHAHLSVQNFAFAIKETLNKLNPEYFLEISIWNGRPQDDLPHYRKSPLRQEGETQFDMWLLRPRVVREYRSWTTPPLENPERYFYSVINSVDRVHNNAILRQFWRSSSLVPNRAKKHFYSGCDLPGYENADRWYLLDSPNNGTSGPCTWNARTQDWNVQAAFGMDELHHSVCPELENPVFALARVQNEPPSRQWLVYAYTPKQPVQFKAESFRGLSCSASSLVRTLDADFPALARTLLTPSDRPLERLNEYLNIPQFADAWEAKYPNPPKQILYGTIQDLRNYTKPFRSQAFSELSIGQQQSIQFLNRLLIEEIYQCITPPWTDPVLNAKVTIPDYGEITLPTVSVGGSFYLINEAPRTVRQITP